MLRLVGRIQSHGRRPLAAAQERPSSAQVQDEAPAAAEALEVHAWAPQPLVALSRPSPLKLFAPQCCPWSLKLSERDGKSLKKKSRCSKLSWRRKLLEPSNA